MAKLTEVERIVLGNAQPKAFGWGCYIAGLGGLVVILTIFSGRRWRVFPLQEGEPILLLVAPAMLALGYFLNRMIDRGQRAYLDRLRREGRLPTIEGRLADVERAALGSPVAQVFAWGFYLAGFGAYAGLALRVFQRGPPIGSLSFEELVLLMAGPILMTAGLTVSRISKRWRLAQLARLQREGRLPGQEIR